MTTDINRPVRPDKATVNSKDWRQYKEQFREWKEARVKKKLDATESSHVKQTKLIRGRSYTLSIALPASILRNAQSNELRTYLAGQIGRAACVFNIDEIVIFDDDDVDQLQDSNPFTASEQLIRLLEYLEW